MNFAGFKENTEIGACELLHCNCNLRKPHSEKSNGIKSDALGGQFISPPRELTIPPSLVQNVQCDMRCVASSGRPLETTCHWCPDHTI